MDNRGAKELLKSSSGHFVQVVLSFVVALTLLGIEIMLSQDQAVGTEDSQLPSVLASKGLLQCSIVFLLSQSFSLAKMLRDNLAVKLENAPEGADFLKGGFLWSMQVLLAFLVALAFAMKGFSGMTLDFDDKAYLGMCILFTLSSTFNLAKTVRDRQDAETWGRMLTDQVNNILKLAEGTDANAFQVVGFTVLSVASTWYGLHNLGLEFETWAFLIMGMLFMIFSAFNLAKSVRDQAHYDRAKHPTAQVMLMQVSAMVASMAITFGGLHKNKMVWSKKRFVGLCLLMCLSGAFNLAKLLRDREEVRRLRERAATNQS